MDPHATYNVYNSRTFTEEEAQALALKAFTRILKFMAIKWVVIIVITKLLKRAAEKAK